MKTGSLALLALLGSSLAACGSEPPPPPPEPTAAQTQTPADVQRARAADLQATLERAQAVEQEVLEAQRRQQDEIDAQSR